MMLFVVTVTLGAILSVPFEFEIESARLKSILTLTGVLAISVIGKGEVEIVTEVGLKLGDSMQVVAYLLRADTRSYRR